MAAPAQPALFMTDRYGEIHFLWHAGDAPAPTAGGLLDWARFISIRCEELPSRVAPGLARRSSLRKNRRAALNPPPSFTRIS